MQITIKFGMKDYEVEVEDSDTVKDVKGKLLYGEKTMIWKLTCNCPLRLFYDSGNGGKWEEMEDGTTLKALNIGDKAFLHADAPNPDHMLYNDQ
mmetsp:Transcript_21376/g.25747  ORF Transcript_21376/g.25747 Transcript_21376/m.25747 type:complete len:94 (-) Transcript_21376:282-563(-)